MTTKAYLKELEKYNIVITEKTKAKGLTYLSIKSNVIKDGWAIFDKHNARSIILVANEGCETEVDEIRKKLLEALNDYTK